jgi:radical SAM superfamily enzyme YgiQ (UPF0313 family)
MYKHLSFELKPLEEIKQDARKARRIYGAAETIFLGDSDSLIHENLPEAVAYIRKTFPEAKRVTSYARAKTVLRDKMEWLADTRKAGLDRLHIGLESGDAVVLKRLCKGASPDQMIKAGQKAKKAGFEVSFYVLSGAGGKDRWKNHALNSARVLNLADPDFIRLRTLTIQKGTPLDKKLESAEFSLTPPLDRLKEVSLFIQTLELDSCYLASDHLTNFLWSGHALIYKGVAGHLPEDKPVMLDILQAAISSVLSSPQPVKDSNLLYREGYFSSL